ncbi:uncharacterized protein BDZ99DRAFT_528121 [Mytilinidion resinicola]|uniref:Uncharacterized protein n=1 Tax=Mytilinidion resinicola TaxID=574789 RepID=A0A6A6XZD2_9PEZI|nr:uncharacterized protein BDZ99DRAFT_528121 [Mytilinidion resinicola]KAF2801648.1 hypothetical protein BDZ99DRAFT_528121 [Mytilinidion resinicola]
MAQVILRVISVTLGILSFTSKEIDKHDNKASVVKIGVALDVKGNGTSGAGGDTLTVQLFNEGGERIGVAPGKGKIESGYYNNYAIGGTYVNCMWIDGDKTNYIQATAFQLHFPDFVPTDQDSFPLGDADAYFKGGYAFKPYWWPNTAPSIVTTKYDQHASLAHDAKALCESPTSQGPDFINTAQGIFCHMGTKKTYPLCGHGLITHCFDAKAMAMIGNGIAAQEEKSYDQVIDWTKESS